MQDRQLAAENLAAAMFKNPECWPTVSEIVQKNDMPEGPCREIFEIFESIQKEGHTPDLETVAARTGTELRKYIVSYINNLISDSDENIRFYAHIVHNQAIAEWLGPMLIKAGYDLSDPDGDFNATITELRTKLDEIVAGESTGNVKTLGGFMVDLIVEQQNDKVKNAKLGFESLDNLTGGYAPGDFDAISARSGGGKSDLAITLAAKLARQDKKVLYESLELYGTSIAARHVSNQAAIPSYLLRDKRLTEPEHSEEMTRMAQVASRDYNLPMLIDERSRLTVPELESQIAKYKPDVVFIDNLDLITPSSKSKDKWRDVETTIHAIKALAKRSHTCIVGLVQLNRTYDKQSPGAAPTMSDLYGGSAIEHDASWVLAVTRTGDYIDSENKAEKVKAHSLKSRDGISGTSVDFATQFSLHRWSEVDTIHE